MALTTQPVKGARDFYPEDMRLQKYIFRKWREVCERFGYEEYDAPILEPTDLYLSKGNEEIISEQTYSFTDRGGRAVTLRTEMTPTVSRMVAGRRQELAYPARWYSIPQCWRYERMQRGRGREFYQLNVDIFGVEGLAADFEMVEVADNIMRAYGATHSMYEFKINSRKLMNSFLQDSLGFDATQAQTVMRLIDRKAKMEFPVFAGQVDAICTPSQRDAGVQDRLMNFLNVSSIEEITEEMCPSAVVTPLRTLMTMLHSAGIKNFAFDPTLMRGFDYYTDIAFEVFDTDPENNRSLFGGGRYDGLVSVFGVEPVAAAGFAMGDITLKNFLESHSLLPLLKPETDLYVVLMGDLFVEAQKSIQSLREMGLRVSLDSTSRKADKQIKSAVKKGIRYALFIGEKELAEDRFMLKDLVTGEGEVHSLERIVSIVKDFRKK